MQVNHLPQQNIVLTPGEKQPAMNTPLRGGKRALQSTVLIPGERLHLGTNESNTL